MHGSSAKKSLQWMDGVQRRIRRAIFYRKNMIQCGVLYYKFNTVYELFIKELVQEVLIGFRSETPLQLLILDGKLEFHRNTS